MEAYKKFWSDSILILVVPRENVFYAQKISDLEFKETYDIDTDFLRIEEMFLRINSENVLHYGKEACKIIGIKE